MCFNLKINGVIPTPLIAKKDIHVYKVINKSGEGWIYNLFINGKEELWTKGYEYEETTPFIDYIKRDWNVYFHGHCFHSCKTLHHAKLKQCSNEIIQKFIIPKGALYYKNDKEYISNRIIYPEQK